MREINEWKEHLHRFDKRADSMDYSSSEDESRRPRMNGAYAFHLGCAQVLMSCSAICSAKEPQLCSTPKSERPPTTSRLDRRGRDSRRSHWGRCIRSTNAPERVIWKSSATTSSR